MKCPRCDVEMVEGIAIMASGDTQWEDFHGLPFFPMRIRDAYKHLFTVLKCPKCGHSEKENIKVIGVEINEE